MDNLKNKLEKFIKEEQDGVSEYRKLLDEMEESQAFSDEAMGTIEDIIEDEEEHIGMLQEIMESLEET